MALHGVLDVSTHVDDVVGRGLVLAVIADLLDAVLADLN